MGYISKHHKFNVGDDVYFCSGDGRMVYRFKVAVVNLKVDAEGTHVNYTVTNEHLFAEDQLSDSANEAFRAWDYEHQQPAHEVIAVEPEAVEAVQ